MKVTATVIELDNNENKVAYEWRDYIKSYLNNPGLIKMTYNLSEHLICDDARLPKYNNTYKIYENESYKRNGVYAKPAIDYVGTLDLDDNIKLGIALCEENGKLILQADAIGLPNYHGYYQYNKATKIERISDLYNINNKKNFTTIFDIEVIKERHDIARSFVIILYLEFNIVEQLTNGLKIWRDIDIADDYLSAVLEEDEEISEDVIAIYNRLSERDEDGDWFNKIADLPEVCDLEYCIKLIASYAEDIVESYKEAGADNLDEMIITI